MIAIKKFATPIALILFLGALITDGFAIYYEFTQWSPDVSSSFTTFLCIFAIILYILAFGWLIFGKFGPGANKSTIAFILGILIFLVAVVLDGYAIHLQIRYWGDENKKALCRGIDLSASILYITAFIMIFYGAMKVKGGSYTGMASMASALYPKK